MEESKDLAIPYQKYLDMTETLVLGGYTGLEVAGVMLAQALTLYKNILSAEEFEEFLQDIIEMQDKVPIITKQNSTLQWNKRMDKYMHAFNRA